MRKSLETDLPIGTAGSGLLASVFTWTCNAAKAAYVLDVPRIVAKSRTTSVLFDVRSTSAAA